MAFSSGRCLDGAFVVRSLDVAFPVDLFFFEKKRTGVEFSGKSSQQNPSFRCTPSTCPPEWPLQTDPPPLNSPFVLFNPNMAFLKTPKTLGLKGTMANSMHKFFKTVRKNTSRTNGFVILIVPKIDNRKR